MLFVLYFFLISTSCNRHTDLQKSREHENLAFVSVIRPNQGERFWRLAAERDGHACPPEPLFMRFPPECRLHTHKEFDAVRKQGKYYPGRLFHLQVLPTEHCPRRVRLGMAVSRKIGKAVVRNKFKRQMRDIFRHFSEQCPISCDIVVIARPGLAKATYWDIKQEFGKRTTSLLQEDRTTNG